MLYKRQAREAVIASICSLFFQSFRRQTNTRIYASLVCPERYFLRYLFPYIKFGGVAQLVRAHGSYPCCPGFESLHRHHNPQVAVIATFKHVTLHLPHNLTHGRGSDMKGFLRLGAARITSDAGFHMTSTELFSRVERY